MTADLRPRRPRPRREPVRADRAAAAEWARGLLAEGFVVVDSETTGFRAPVEFVEIAVVEGGAGAIAGARVLLNTRVRPRVPVEPAATSVHGISPVELLRAPAFEEIHPELVRVLSGRRIVAYNAAFDRRVFAGCLKSRGLPDAAPHPDADSERPWECAMLWYSRFRGEAHPKNPGRLKRHKLVEAAGAFTADPLEKSPADHTALGDALATLRVVEGMAGRAPTSPPPPAEPDVG